MKESEKARLIGLTDEEAKCWEMTADLASVYISLPIIHKMDHEEVCHAIHIIQEKLLSRPAYRSYLELNQHLAGEGE